MAGSDHYLRLSVRTHVRKCVYQYNLMTDYAVGPGGSLNTKFARLAFLTFLEKTALIMKKLLNPAALKIMAKINPTLAAPMMTNMTYQNQRKAKIFSEMILGANKQRKSVVSNPEPLPTI